ncbi:MAG: cytochrome c oxidase assembly protein [Bosea sp.]|uniref:cytochrome c oxidase assembly protein n=1 Tax=Bosea sp. (in: a-proteobacteria) TaxID=1871050 RepID=UPI001AC3D1B8|nr:cytochrome c oxidase assembly protein [Bosea sp. (in: a-proteobacteria)]MBN9450860.1 cytochrome c oxidase assembly protein [Bosea sp. (in: a-proteobacteria)]
MTNAAPQRPRGNPARTALICVGVAFGMLGASFAAVPLYDLFCRVTGFGGRPLVGTAGTGKILDRTMSVRFDANVAPGLGWKFEAESPEIKVQVGATQTVFYKMTNRSDRTVTGIATYNVAPEKGAAYFVKIQCFCFTEHTLKPGESFEAPVVFYIDPEIAENRELDGVHAITLSYTYFASKSGQPVAEGKAGPVKGDAGNSKL